MLLKQNNQLINILMQDNIPSHSAKQAIAHLAKKGFKDTKLTEWLSASPDNNPIKNLSSIIKRHMRNENQYSIKEDLESNKIHCK